MSNGYPQYFIINIVRKFVTSKFVIGTKDHSNDTNTPVILIPFIGNPSLVLKKRISRILKSVNISVRIIFKSMTVQQYFSLKDRSHNMLRSSLVYKFQCPDDPSTSYIGKTKRYLNKRVSEHRKSNSAINTHLLTCNTCCSVPDLSVHFKVLSRANTDFELRILEALLITEHRPDLNKQLSGDGMSFILNIF